MLHRKKARSAAPGTEDSAGLFISPQTDPLHLPQLRIKSSVNFWTRFSVRFFAIVLNWSTTLNCMQIIGKSSKFAKK